MTTRDAAAAESTYHAPGSVREAVALLANADDATVVAGGQTVMLLMQAGALRPSTVVDVSGIDELVGVCVDGDDEGAAGDGGGSSNETRVSIGAATTYADLLADDLTDAVGALGDAVAGIADTQVRNMGTVGGAVASGEAALDLIPVLLCLEATVRLRGPRGRRTVELAEFYRADAASAPPVRSNFVDSVPTAMAEDELLTGVTVDCHGGASGWASAYRKQTTVAGGSTTAGVAAAVALDAAGERFESVRVGVAALAATGVRAEAVESALVGAPVGGGAVESALDHLEEDVDPSADHTGSAAYRLSVGRTLARRTIADAVERAGGAL